VTTEHALGTHTREHAPPPRGWWRVKIAAGAALIALLVAHFVFGLVPVDVAFPRETAQAIAVLGGLFTVWHHRILSTAVTSNCPTRLVSTGGCYPFIRHPMYLGDMVLYVGLALLAPGAITAALAALGCAALYLQARAEDRHLERQFGEPFMRWQQSSGLLLPGLG